MYIDSSVNSYADPYKSKADSTLNVSVSNYDAPLVNIEAKEVEVKNVKATQELQSLKVDIRNDSELGTQEKQTLLSKLEEQLNAQYLKSFSEKEEPVKNNVPANNINVNKLHQTYQMQDKQSTSSFSELA